jgi:hypothetical protein
MILNLPKFAVDSIESRGPLEPGGRQKDTRHEGTCEKASREEGILQGAGKEGTREEEEVIPLAARIFVTGIAASLASLVAVALVAGTAAAASLTNRDEREHRITVIEGDSKQDHVLKPSAVLDGICQKGCIVRLNDSDNDEYELEGLEIVSIEDGYLYYDGPDTPVEPAPGEPGKPPGPKQ